MPHSVCVETQRAPALTRGHDVVAVGIVRQTRVVAVLVGPQRSLVRHAAGSHHHHAVTGDPGAAEDVRARRQRAAAVVDESHDLHAPHRAVDHRVELGLVVDYIEPVGGRADHAGVARALHPGAARHVRREVGAAQVQRRRLHHRVELAVGHRVRHRRVIGVRQRSLLHRRVRAVERGVGLETNRLLRHRLGRVVTAGRRRRQVASRASPARPTHRSRRSTLQLRQCLERFSRPRAKIATARHRSYLARRNRPQPLRRPLVARERQAAQRHLQQIVAQRRRPRRPRRRLGQHPTVRSRRRHLQQRLQRARLTPCRDVTQRLRRQQQRSVLLRHRHRRRRRRQHLQQRRRALARPQVGQEGHHVVAARKARVRQQLQQCRHSLGSDALLRQLRRDAVVVGVAGLGPHSLPQRLRRDWLDQQRHPVQIDSRSSPRRYRSSAGPIAAASCGKAGASLSPGIPARSSSLLPPEPGPTAKRQSGSGCSRLPRAAEARIEPAPIPHRRSRKLGNPRQGKGEICRRMSLPSVKFLTRLTTECVL